MIILINTSKTMGQVAQRPGTITPALKAKTKQLVAAIQGYSTQELGKLMHISPSLAERTKALYTNWEDQPTTAALDAFQGDIFKGLRAHDFTEAERTYANQHLRIISGLYGVLFPFDAIRSYRLELAYQLRVDNSTNLYEFWGGLPAKLLPPKGPIVQLASQEYFRLLEPYLNPSRVITPRFLTKLPGAGADFVTVHTKVTRGAFARWMIQRRIDHPARLKEFDDLGYRYDPTDSTEASPLFITNTAIKPTQLQ